MACLISFQVITRMNILVAVLCLIMGRPYQFYYFVPLVTFWFVVVYAVMALWPRVTAARVKGEYDFSDQVLPVIILLSSLKWYQRFTLQSRCFLGENLATIFDSNSSGRLEKERNFYQGGGWRLGLGEANMAG